MLCDAFSRSTVPGTLREQRRPAMPGGDTVSQAPTYLWFFRDGKNGSNRSYNCTPFLHSLLTKGKKSVGMGPGRQTDDGWSRQGPSRHHPPLQRQQIRGFLMFSGVLRFGRHLRIKKIAQTGCVLEFLILEMVAHDNYVGVFTERPYLI